MELGGLGGEARAELGGVGDGDLGEVGEDDVFRLLEVALDFGDEIFLFSAHGCGSRLDFAELGGGQLHAGAHRGRDENGLDVNALEGGGFGLRNRVDDGGGVLGDGGGGEGALADADADVGGLVHLELHATGLDGLDRADDVVGHGAGLRVGHEALGTEDAGEGADLLHGLGGRDGDIEVEPALGDLGHHVLETGMIGAGLDGLLRIVGEDEHADLLARAVGKRGGAAHHLVALGRIDAEAEGELDGLVELGGREFTKQLDGFGESVALGEVGDLDGGPITFAGLFWHVGLLAVQAPLEGLPRLVGLTEGGKINRRLRCPCCGRCRR